MRSSWRVAMLTTSSHPHKPTVVAAYRSQTVDSELPTTAAGATLRKTSPHVAVVVLITQALTAADVRDPDLEHQHLTANR